MKLGYTEEFKISLIKADKEIYETYTGELKILFKKPNIKTCCFTEYRDWVVCDTLAGTGIRVGTLIEQEYRMLITKQRNFFVPLKMIFVKS